MSFVKSLSLFAVLATFPACEIDADDGSEAGEAVSVSQAELIHTVGTSNPVGVDTYDWNGDLTHHVIFDGDVKTGGANGTVLTYKVGSAVNDPDYKLLTFSMRDGKLTVVGTTYLRLDNGIRLLIHSAVAETTPNVGTALKMGSSSPSYCTAGPLGPFVRSTSSCYSPLLDQRLLSKIPSPKYLNGAPPTTRSGVEAVATSYAQLYANHLLLWDTFRYRAELNGSGFNRQMVYDALDEFLGTTDSADHHHHIDHNEALGDANEDWTDLGHHGGFLDGHRAFLEEFTPWLLANPGYKMPFQRIPAWIPTTVPVEFQADTSQDNGGSGIPSQYAAGNVCSTYNTAGTPVRLDAMLALGVGAFNGWHGSIHGFYGGTFGAFNTAATAPLFWPWHTAVDTVWANLQHCYLDDGDSL